MVKGMRYVKDRARRDIPSILTHQKEQWSRQLPRGRLHFTFTCMSNAASTWVRSSNVPSLPSLFSLSLQRIFKYTESRSSGGGLQHQWKGECSLLCYLPLLFSRSLHWHAAALFPFKLIAPVGNTVSAHSSAPAITLYYSISRLPYFLLPSVIMAFFHRLSLSPTPQHCRWRHWQKRLVPVGSKPAMAQ